MGFLDRMRSKATSSGDASDQPRLIKKQQQGGSTYETYAGTDPEAARNFLEGKSVTKPQYYVVVETSDGVWGKDKEGLYLENVRPWQTDTAAADCEAGAARMTGMGTVIMAARGITDNFISIIECGSCGREWSDGVRYQAVTLAKCPGCGMKNSVDTSHINVVG